MVFLNRIFLSFFRITITFFLGCSVAFSTEVPYGDHVKLKEFFEQQDLDATAILLEEYDNQENLAHKILKYLQMAYLEYQLAVLDKVIPDRKKIHNYLFSLEKLYQICGIELFERPNNKGDTPFSAYSIEFSNLFTEMRFPLQPDFPLFRLLLSNYLTLRNKDPDFFLIRWSTNDTPLMHLALYDPNKYHDVAERLTEIEKSIDQKDFFGNTAEQWMEKRALGANYPLVLKNLKHDLSAESLDTNFWDKVAQNYPYDFTDQNRLFIFDALAFNAALLNQDKTGIKESFLQRNITTRQNEANQLWEVFFKTRDALMVKRISKFCNHDDGYMERMKEIPNAIRVLECISYIEDSLWWPERRETTQIIRSKILSTGGTFGINFKRTATVEEAKVMKDSIDSFVRHVGSRSRPNIAKEIMDSFFVPYPLSLEKAQQEALDRHQVNCVILGLFSALNTPSNPSEALFSEIDTLVAQQKNCHASAIRSQDRYNKLKAFIEFE